MGQAPEFKPCLIQLNDADVLEFVSEDIPTLSRRVNDSLDILYDLENRDRVIGFRLHGAKNYLAEMGKTNASADFL